MDIKGVPLKDRKAGTSHWMVEGCWLRVTLLRINSSVHLVLKGVVYREARNFNLRKEGI